MQPQSDQNSDRRFAGCPECGDDDGYVNHGRVHFLVCLKHKVKWFIGSNLFSCWKHETEEEQTKSLELLATLREVKGVHSASREPVEVF